MDNGNNLKHIAQNILDTSYKIYSDVSLINSSLFRAASSLGVELPEIPQISLAAGREPNTETALRQASSAMEKLSTGRKTPLFGISRKTVKEREKEEEEPTGMTAVKLSYKSGKMVAEQHEQKVNKMVSEVPAGQAPIQANLEEESRSMVASTSKPQETKVTLEEKEAKLNKLQTAMPSKVNVSNKEETQQISPLESISPKDGLTPQSELQKKIFETTNFGKIAGVPKKEEPSEITNNPLNGLLILIKNKHSLTVTQAAQALNVNRELIEKWAKILSQNSLIRIRYQLMGDTILEA